MHYLLLDKAFKVFYCGRKFSVGLKMGVACSINHARQTSLVQGE